MYKLKLPWLKRNTPNNSTPPPSPVISDFVIPLTKKHNVAFVTFANGVYLRLVDKWKSSIEKYCPNSDIFIFTDYSQIGCPSHKDSPYAFKPYAIELLKSKGYDTVFWCDSCIRLAKSIDTLIPEIKTRGVYLQNDGWVTGQWANDTALEYFGLTRDDAMTMSAIYACIMAFDFKQEISHRFLHLWKKAADDGIFQGKWKNDDRSESQDSRCTGHRHDQTCAELISHQLNIPRGVLIVVPNNIDNPNRYFTSWDHI